MTTPRRSDKTWNCNGGKKKRTSVLAIKVFSAYDRVFWKRTEWIYLLDVDHRKRGQTHKSHMFRTSHSYKLIVWCRNGSSPECLYPLCLSESGCQRRFEQRVRYVYIDCSETCKLQMGLTFFVDNNHACIILLVVLHEKIVFTYRSGHTIFRILEEFVQSRWIIRWRVLPFFYISSVVRNCKQNECSLIFKSNEGYSKISKQ